MKWAIGGGSRRLTQSAGERRKDGAYGTGLAYDTSPQKGCCTATLVAVG
jgi:hypothetical protein